MLNYFQSLIQIKQEKHEVTMQYFINIGCICFDRFFKNRRFFLKESEVTWQLEKIQSIAIEFCKNSIEFLVQNVTS